MNNYAFWGKTRRSVLMHCGMVVAFSMAVSCREGREEAPDVLAGERQGDAFYVTNGQVRLGIDLARGGSIFYFSGADGRNLLNHADEGRFIQQSYYGEPDGSDWHGKPWVWNPIQGGGSNGEKARILSFGIENDTLHIVSEPIHWASGKPVAETEMEARISMKGDVAHIRYTLRNTGEGATDHPAAHQELPAVFADADLPYLVYYGREKPWTGDTLTRLIPGWPNEEHTRTEEWAAYADSTGWGIGVYTPGTPLSTTYRFEGDGVGGPDGGACSYFAPVRTFAVTKGMVFSYDVYLSVGKVESMRARFDSVRAKNDFK